MISDDDFGTLRSLVQTPSRDHWKRLCGMLDRHKRDWQAPYMQENVLPYVRWHMSHWPETMPRYAQHSWLHDAMNGYTPPQLQFATALHLVGQELTHKRLVTLFDCPMLLNMSIIDLSGKTLGDELLLNLLANPSLTKLRELDLSNTSITALGAQLLIESKHLKALRRLELNSNSLREADSLLKLDQACPELEHLGLAAVKLNADAIERAVLRFNLPRLRTLDVRHCGAQAKSLLRRLRESKHFPQLERVIV